MARLVKSLLHGSGGTLIVPPGRGWSGATSPSVAPYSPNRFPALSLERGQHFGGTDKGAVDAALLEVVQSFREGPINDGLGREHNLPFVNLCFQKVANLDRDLFPYALRDYHLVFVLDGNNRHGVSSTIQLFN